ncbi:MAG: 4-oxalomesaconate tautomerase [Acidimicrobiales bacterium]
MGSMTGTTTEAATAAAAGTATAGVRAGPSRIPQRAIDCTVMRGGTSKSVFFLARDLPPGRARRDEVLLRAMGSPDTRQIDGLGGATTVTSKVAIISPSPEPGIDVDYGFAQVEIAEARVDTAPTCGNTLSAVGPYAVERGLVPATTPVTRVTIRDVNTGAVVEAGVPTPDRMVAYDGGHAIDGVPGTAAPVELSFRGIAGAVTGAVFPTGRRSETIDGVEVTCIDVAMPMVLAAARSFGLNGHEPPAGIDAMMALTTRIEALRLEAGKRMGLGDVSRSVVPKVGLLAPPRGDGHLSSRYLTPWRCHVSHAVSGAIAVCCAAAVPDTVAAAVLRGDGRFPHRAVLEHPSGTIGVRLDLTTGAGGDLVVRSAGIERTARTLMVGQVMVPWSVWPPDT